MSDRCKHIEKSGFNCGSYAFNLYKDGIDQGNLCDVHYWQAKALAQPEQEPVALEAVYETIIQWDEGGGKRSRRELARRIVALYTTPLQRTERPVDCERCNRLEEQAYDLVGKLRVANIKLSMQPQRTWVGLTPQQRDEINERVYGAVPHHVVFHHAIEAKLKELNT